MAAEESGSRRLSVLAAVSLICAVLWACGIGSLLAVLLGHIALRRIGRHGLGGRWIALAGLLLGYIGLVITFVMLLQGGLDVQDRGTT